MAQVTESKYILMAFLTGLFFFSMNKVLMSIYYALHEMWIPAIITIVVTGINIFLNSWWISQFQATGLALATVTSAAIQTILFIIVLHTQFKFRLYHLNFIQFVYRYFLQLAVIFPIFFGLYRLVLMAISYLPSTMINTLTMTVAFWLWVVPLSFMLLFSLFYSRDMFKVRLYFLR